MLNSYIWRGAWKKAVSDIWSTVRLSSFQIALYLLVKPRLQIIFVYKQVICQARETFWPRNKPVWSDKKKDPLRNKNNIREGDLFDTFPY